MLLPLMGTTARRCIVDGMEQLLHLFQLCFCFSVVAYCVQPGFFGRHGLLALLLSDRERRRALWLRRSRIFAELPDQAR